MNKPCLLFISMGELATHLLEAVARSDIFDTIVVASRDLEKAKKRANNAVLGAGIEGFFPSIISEKLDVHSNDFFTKLKKIKPDFIFSAPSLLPWWKLAPDGIDMPFAGYTALHLSLMQKFRNQIAEAGVNSIWIGASFPDVINAMLNRTGFGPDFGIGNVQEPIAKIQIGVGRELNCSPQNVEVKLVAQHAFEYFVLNDRKPDKLPPYLLKTTVAGKDVTKIAENVLRQVFPFPYDLHFNRVTASSALVALHALTGEVERSIHLPGIGTLVGGYPVRVGNSCIKIDLPDEWSMEQAIAVCEASLKWDGIDEMTEDGTIVFTVETQKALRELLGKNIETLSTETAQDQANDLLHVLS